MRNAAIATLLALTTLAAAGSAAGQALPEITGALATPTLKRNVIVTDEIVRIGDLIENAGRAAQIAIFRAPDLGTTGAVPAAQVIQSARTHGVIGINAAGASEIVVTRAGRAISGKDVEAAIAQALAHQNRLADDSEMTVRLDREPRSLHVEAGIASPLQVVRLSYDARSGQFDALLEVPGSAAARKLSLRFTGKALETVEVAVVTRSVARGDVVRRADVVTERRPKSEAGSDIATHADRLVGLAARRPLRAGQILRTADLARPELVQRNESVTLLFEVPGIVLTSRAKALESGAEGDVISVLNPQSKRTVQGTVTGPNTVTVTSMKPQVAAVASAEPATLHASRTE